MTLRTVFLLCAAVASLASHAGELPRELSPVPNPTARVKEVSDSIHAQFTAALRDFDDGVARNPHDVTAALDRCRFIAEFAGTYEYTEFADDLYQSADACFEQLQDERPEHPEVVLSRLDRTYGEDRFQSGLTALDATALQSWTSGQMSRLYTWLAEAAQTVGDRRSFEFAQRALRLDEAADVRMLLATEWVERGDRTQVVRLLTSPVDGHSPQDVWYLVNKMRLLADVGAREAVIENYKLLRDHESFDAVAAAGALRRVGAVAEAREAFDRAATLGSTLNSARERFRFELESGDSTQALAAYDAWRDEGWWEDPLAINRFALFVREPSLPLQARDLLMVPTLLAALAMIALLAAAPVGCVHYWGLARRARKAEAYPQGGWGLRHAWLALLAFSGAQLVAMYMVGPLDINAVDGRIWGLDATPTQMATLALAAELLVLVFLLPLASTARRVQPHWWSSHWSPVASIAVGVLLGVIFRAPLLWYVARNGGDFELGGSQQVLWQILQAMRDTHGIATAFWMVAVAAPVLEEFIFRGVLLRAFTQHIRFAWANVLQAALFALVHFDTQATPMLFVVGLCLGFLAQRSGGLLGPMTLHLVFNLILALVAFT